MANGTPGIELLDHLPEVFRADEVAGDSFIRRFLQIFAAVFAGLQSELDAIPDLFDPASVPGLVGTPTAGAAAPPTYLAQHDVTPPAAPDLLLMRERRANALLAWLAGWVGLPSRPDKGPHWNAEFIQTAIPLIPQRGTVGSLQKLLAAYLKGDVTGVSLSDAGGWIVGVSRLGIDSVLNATANPAYTFTVTLSGLTEGSDVAKEVKRLASRFLDREAPAHTAYVIKP